jgi:hypothetical protein
VRNDEFWMVLSALLIGMAFGSAVVLVTLAVGGAL